MRLIFSILATLLLLSGSARAEIYSSTLTVTNVAGVTNGQTIEIQSDTRTWTNAVYTPAAQILTNSTAGGAAVNLLTHLASYPVAGLSVWIYSSTAIRIQSTNGAAWFAVTPSSGWATVTYATNTITPSVLVRIPFTVEAAAQQTNIASGLAAAINSSANTNAISYAVQSLHSTNSDLATLATTAVSATNAQTATLASYVSGDLTNRAAFSTNSTLAAYVSGVLTNQASGQSVFYPTNQAGVLIDMSKNADWSTNAAFAFSGFSNLSTTNYESRFRIVTNSSGSTFAVTPPPGMLATNGTWYVTNAGVTVFSFFNNAGRWTNGIAYPIK